MLISSAYASTLLAHSSYDRPSFLSCNWLGVGPQALPLYHPLNALQGYASVLAMDWYGNETLHNTPLSNITLDGTPIAAVANVGNFSFAYVPLIPRRNLRSCFNRRVFAAGHEVVRRG